MTGHHGLRLKAHTTDLQLLFYRISTRPAPQGWWFRAITTTRWSWFQGMSLTWTRRTDWHVHTGWDFPLYREGLWGVYHWSPNILPSKVQRTARPCKLSLYGECSRIVWASLWMNLPWLVVYLLFSMWCGVVIEKPTVSCCINRVMVSSNIWD